MNLNDESRERVLENVKALMVVTDWSYFDPHSVKKLESANAQQWLNKILTENENAQRKRAAEGSDQIPFDAPMTSHAYGETMNNTLEK